MANDAFSPESVAAIKAQWNGARVDDARTIVQGVGGKPAVIIGRLAGLAPEGATFEAHMNSGSVSQVSVPWATVPASESEIQAEMERMFRESCVKLGRAVPQG